MSMQLDKAQCILKVSERTQAVVKEENCMKIDTIDKVLRGDGKRNFLFFNRARLYYEHSQARFAISSIRKYK